MTVAGSVVTARLVAQAARVNGDKLWTPEAVWQAGSIVAPAGWAAGVDPGIERLDTTGAVPLDTRMRDAREAVRLALDMVSVADWAAWMTFWTGTLDGGLKAFTLAWADKDQGRVRTAKVRLEDGTRERGATAKVCGWRDWELAVIVAGEGTYL